MRGSPHEFEWAYQSHNKAPRCESETTPTGAPSADADAHTRGSMWVHGAEAGARAPLRDLVTVDIVNGKVPSTPWAFRASSRQTFSPGESAFPMLLDPFLSRAPFTCLLRGFRVFSLPTLSAASFVGRWDSEAVASFLAAPPSSAAAAHLSFRSAYVSSRLSPSPSPRCFCRTSSPSLGLHCVLPERTHTHRMSSSLPPALPCPALRPHTCRFLGT